MSTARAGVYIHFPYCLSKCPYCDFASTATAYDEDRYTRAVLAELEVRRVRWPRRQVVESVYFGGGTPSLWSAASVGRVLEALDEAFTLSSGCEVTLEANPGAADAARFEGLVGVGINRLSLGVQSFDARTLKALGREHDGDDAKRAYASARRAGFHNVSMDFLYGVHGQRLEEVEADARTAASLGPSHLSAYALTLDRESLAEEVPLAKQLARGEVSLPADEVVVAMQRAVRDAYAAVGLVRYEVSNYAQPGYHSRHNTLYWTQGEYLALGAGATGAVRGDGWVRYSNHRSAPKYLEAVEAGESPSASEEQLLPLECFEERVAMGLRLSSGVALAEVCADFGVDFAPRRAVVEQLTRAGLLETVDGRVRLTDRGFDVHSAISARLM